MMKKINNDSFILLRGWMIEELDLKGNELIVYAVIYGFNRDGHAYQGSRQYLARWTNSTVQGVQKNLNSLVEKKLIIKKEVFKDNKKLCMYYINRDAIQDIRIGNNVIEDVTELQENVTELTGGSKQSFYNNIDIDNIDNNIDNNIYSDFEQVIKQKYLGKKTKAIRDKVVPKLLKKYSVEELTRCLDRYALECRGREKKYIMNESTFWNGRYIDYLDCNYEDNNTGKARVASTKKPKLSDF